MKLQQYTGLHVPINTLSAPVTRPQDSNHVYFLPLREAKNIDAAGDAFWFLVSPAREEELADWDAKPASMALSALRSAALSAAGATGTGKPMELRDA